MGRRHFKPEQTAEAGSTQTEGIELNSTVRGIGVKPDSLCGAGQNTILHLDYLVADTHLYAANQIEE